MATSGNFSTNKYSTSSQGTIGLNLSWSLTSQSIADNTSTIKWTLKSNGTMSSGSWVMGGPISAYINGTRVFYQSGRFHVNGGGGYKKSGSITVAHGTDGSKTVAMSISGALYSTSQNCKASKSYALPKIDRYALLDTVEDISDVYSEFPTITYTNALGTQVTGIKARITWNNGANYTDWSEELPNDLSQTGGIGTYTFPNTILTDSIRDTLLGLCSNATSLPIEYEIVSTLTVGETPTEYSNTKSANLVVNPETAQPTWSSQNPLTYADIDTSITTITQDPSIIVQLHSTMELTISAATGNKGATIGSFDDITAYYFTLNGQTYGFNSSGKATFVKPNVAGTYTAVVTVRDSRGYINTTSIDIAVVPWTLPFATCSLARKDNFYTETNLKVEYSIASVSSINAVQVWEQHKRADDVNWSTLADITSDITGSQTYTKVFPETGQDVLDNRYSYMVRVFVGDLFTTGTIDENNTTLSVYTMSVDRGVPLFFIDRWNHSLAMNALPKGPNQFYCVGTIEVDPKEELNGGVKLPHVYSETPQIVGYWLDGRPIYELTVELSSAVTLSANAWNNSVYTHSEDIIVLDVEAKYYDSTTGLFSNWGFIASQSVSSDKKVVALYNSRDVSCLVNRLTLKYMKPLPTV